MGLEERAVCSTLGFNIDGEAFTVEIILLLFLGVLFIFIEVTGVDGALDVLALSLLTTRGKSFFFTALLLLGGGGVGGGGVGVGGGGVGVGGGLISFNTAGRGGDLGRAARLDDTDGYITI